LGWQQGVTFERRDPGDKAGQALTDFYKSEKGNPPDATEAEKREGTPRVSRLVERRDRPTLKKKDERERWRHWEGGKWLERKET